MGLSCAFLYLLAIIHFLCFSFTSAIAIHRNNETDQQALLQFKAKISNNDPLEVMSLWNGSVHFCQWYGVVCGRRHKRVTLLNLSSLKLSGSITPYIGNLSFLRELYLQNNSFTHEIPPQIGYLRRLQVLSLYNNSFTGQIPHSISNCSNLVYIYLDSNKLSGEIPVWLGSLLKLQDIRIGINNLTGNLPSSLGNLSSLQNLHVDDNNLDGILPNTLGQLVNLKILQLFQNWFSGTIPLSIFNLSSVNGIDMAYNQLEGELPLALGVSFPKIRFFSIIVNQFTGSIPTSFSNASSLEELQLGGNYFTGRVPSLDKLHRLLSFNIAENHLGNGKADDLEFFSTITNATNLVTLAIDVNNFGGKLPEQFCNFSKKLQNMYIAYNQIFGNIPNSVSDCAALEVLMAAENKLSGIIPSSIEKLQNLRLLFLDNNDFFGSIPSSIGNMTNLIRTDLSNNILEGNIPWTLGNCKSLLELNLSNNNLSGPIPPQIFELSSLSLALDLSRNHLSGTILSEVGNLKNIEHLSLSENFLSGVIPSGLSSCTSLQFLYMGANFFQDTIPSSLSSLRGLQELNLSHNMLSGKIPEFLKDFHFLELVDLSYNNFEDMVPIEGVFKNATATSIVGNENLCGGIPDFRLPPCKLEKSKKGLTGKLKIVISMVSVLVSVGLVLVCLFLYHSRKKKGESKSRSFGNSLLKLSYQSLLKATNEFSSDNLIGTGSFGSVYKGILDQEGIVIAVKVLNLMRQGASKSFITECEALRNIKHRNLVKVLTACSGVDYRGNDFKALIYEFMVNGSLEDWLHPTPRLDEMPRTLNILQRLNIVIDVTCALEYLHHHSGTPIVHCDLKPSNVLLDEEMTGHVSDFGLAKFLSNGMLESSASQSISIGIRGTIGYCAPEYAMGSKISTFGDIFSFGILLLEIFTGKRPTDDIFKEGLNLHNFVKRALPEEVADITDPYLLQTQLNTDATSNHTHNFRNMMRNNKTIECLISIFKIGISCSVESPQERMSIGDAAAQLSSIKNKLIGTRLLR